MKNICFLSQHRKCGEDCTAFVPSGNTNCRLLNTLEKLVPVQPRPVAPPPPKAKI